MDPGVEKARAKAIAKINAGNTFEAVALEYIAQRSDSRNSKVWAPATLAKQEWLFGHLRPAISSMPIANIRPIDLLNVQRKIEFDGKLETAQRVQQFASMVFRYAVATARLDSDPMRDLRGALTSPRPKHHGAIVDSVKAGELMRAIDGYEGYPATMYALRLAPHLFVRPGELRYAEWPEVDLEAAVWTIPAGRMKMRKPQVVPLSRQAVDLFRSWQELSGPKKGYICPSVRTTARAMSENTLNAALRLGYPGDEMTAHGFRGRWLRRCLTKVAFGIPTRSIERWPTRIPTVCVRSIRIR